DPMSIADSELLGSANLQALRSEYLTAERERQSLLASGKGVNHPEVKSAEARADASHAALVKEVNTVKEAVGRELSSARREAAKQRALDLNLLEIEYRRLERDKVNTEKLYTTVLERTKASDLARVMRFNNLHVIERPIEPSKPVCPNVPAMVVVGLVTGLVL